MFFHVFAEEGRIRKSELVANLLNAVVGVAQIVAYVLKHMFANPLVGSLSRIVLADYGEVFRTDA